MLRRIDIALARQQVPFAQTSHILPSDVSERYRNMLLRLDVDSSASEYLSTHLDRLVQTLALVPSPSATGRILELGCYNQITSLLASELGYQDVRGAYFGEAGCSDEATARANGEVIFRCRIDLFDVEKDQFPYEDESFDTVLACEIIEHLAVDPMHMLLECRRVLVDGGALLLTTPNCVGISAVARCLKGTEAPQIFSRYPHPAKNEACGPHVREYAPAEVVKALQAAGYRLETLLTERQGDVAIDTWAEDVLQSGGFETTHRGEQIYCLCRKDSTAVLDRHPQFLYESAD